MIAGSFARTKTSLSDMCKSRLLLNYMPEFNENLFKKLIINNIGLVDSFSVVSFL